MRLSNVRKGCCVSCRGRAEARNFQQIARNFLDMAKSHGKLQASDCSPGWHREYEWRTRCECLRENRWNWSRLPR